MRLQWKNAAPKTVHSGDWKSGALFCVCVGVLPSAREADESHHVTRYCCHQTVVYTTASCCYVIPMYNERMLIHATLRQVKLSSLHSLLPFNRMYAGLNSLDLLHVYTVHQ